MSGTARIGSIDSVRHFRAVLRTFELEAREALGSFDLEVQRALTWISEDLPERWQHNLRVAEEAVHQATLELQQARRMTLPGGGVPSCLEEKKALQKAKDRRDYAEDKLRTVRQWAGKVHREATEYTGQAGQLGGTLDADVPKALATLDRVLKSIEDYQLLRAPTGPGLSGPPSGAAATATTSAQVAKTAAAQPQAEGATAIAQPAPTADAAAEQQSNTGAADSQTSPAADPTANPVRSTGT